MKPLKLAAICFLATTLWMSGITRAKELPAPIESSAQAPSAAASASNQRFITIDFQDVDINLFIRYISELTGKNFVVDKSVTGNVTVVSPTQITEDEAYRVFLSVLDVNGYSTVDAGPITKIIPTVKARSENLRTFRSGMSGDAEDKMVTQLIPLKYSSPDDVAKILKPLVSKTSVIISDTQSSMLIVTDTLANIQRLMSIVDAIDVAYTGTDTVVIPLEYADVTKVSKVLSSLFQKAKSSKKKSSGNDDEVKIVAYERTNALIVVAVPTEIDRIKKLVKLLDVEMEKSTGNIHVAYLKNANATDVAEVLNFLPQQSSTSSKSDEGNKSKAPAISTSVKIMADEETNSLIIRASASEFRELQEVINKLDIPRRMVYLEALIMEVSTTKNFTVGVDWAIGGENSSGTVTGAAGYTGDADDPYSLLSGMSESSPTSTEGFTFGVIGSGIEIGGVTFPSIGAVLNAYKEDSDITVISTPQILTTDNKEAVISVGENVPYITSENTSSSDEDYTNYEYKDVSTSLTITPHISQGNTLRLEIATEVIKLKDNTNNTPTTYTRTATTNVAVRDRDTVVIGGIIGEDSTTSDVRIPLLGDIPIIGRLFRNDDDTDTKTNMYIFITPKIIANPSELAQITADKKSSIKKVVPDAASYFTDTNASHSTKLCELGIASMKKGETNEAKAYFNSALEIEDENPYALYNMGVLAEADGDVKLADTMYRRLIATGTEAKAGGATLNAQDKDSPLIRLARKRLEKLEAREDAKKNKNPNVRVLERDEER